MLNSLQDLPSNTRDLHKAGWHPSTEDRYNRAWQSFKRHLRSSNLSLNQVGVKHVMNYITHLHNLKLSYSTINLHRSAISMTLPNLDGVPMGSHPLVSRLCKGTFTKRPPPRKVLSVRDPTPVLDIFMHSSLPLGCAQFVRKCAFILAILYGRRLSELFRLKCDDKHIVVNNPVWVFPGEVGIPLEDPG
jgi:site-specific recombinase XerD